MFKIRIWYDDTTVTENFPVAIEVIFINSGKIIVCLLDNQPIENFITPFVTKMVFYHVGLSWNIQSNQKIKFDFQYHCTSWIPNGPWYNTMIC